MSVAKSYIQPDSGEDDDLIALLIKWASSQIRDFTQRVFTKPPAVGVMRSVYFSHTRSVRLDDPLKDVTEIVAPIDHYVDGEPYPYERVLDPSEYEIQTRPNGTTLRLDYPGSGRFDVTGTWGWESIPGTIEQACVVTADEWFRGNVLPPTGTREEGAAEGRNLYLPREVQEMLAPWQLLERIA